MARHPDFVRFVAELRHGRHAEALTLIEGLLLDFPQEHWLHWHRSTCLEALGRFDEMVQSLDATLALQPDFVRAIVKRAQFLAFSEAEDEQNDEGADEDPNRARQRFEQALLRSRRIERELRRALALEPANPDTLAALADLLHARQDPAAGDAPKREAQALLDQAIGLAPQRVDLLEQRATRLRSQALGEYDGGDDALETFQGLRYSRSGLEAALADYERCFALDGKPGHAVRAGSVLHDLGRHEEALLRFDQALAAMAPEDPLREFVQQARARSEDGGRGEREEIARLMEQALHAEVGDGDRTLAQDHAAQTILGAVRAVRAGRSLPQALDARMSDDPDTMLATNIAQQILNLAHEPAPQLEEVDSRAYPGYQRRFVDKVAKQAEPAGLVHVADGEAHGLFPTLGQHVLIRFFADESGEIGLASFVLKPKWPGLVGFLFLLLTGKWRQHPMVECVSQFDDGTLLSTQYDSVSAFEYGGAVRIEKLPRGTAVQAMVERHQQRVAAHKAAFPAAVAMVADDLAGMERRWIEGQRVKRAYRVSVGYATDAELQRLLGGQHARFGGKVREQLQVLAADFD